MSILQVLGVCRFFPILLNISPTVSAGPSADQPSEALEAVSLEFSVFRTRDATPGGGGAERTREENSLRNPKTLG